MDIQLDHNADKKANRRRRLEASNVDVAMFSFSEVEHFSWSKT